MNLPFDLGDNSPLQLADIPPNTVLRDFIDDETGLRGLVVRGPIVFCAYVGVRSDHTLAGLEELDFDCHYGITFQSWGSTDSIREPDWYWWGWDYGHFSDQMDLMSLLPLDAPRELREAYTRMQAAMDGLARSPKNWTIGEIERNVREVIAELTTALRHSNKLSQLLLAKPDGHVR